MSEKKKVKINGFVFTDEAEAEQAKKEAQIGRARTWDSLCGRTRRYASSGNGA